MGIEYCILLYWEELGQPMGQVPSLVQIACDVAYESDQ